MTTTARRLDRRVGGPVGDHARRDGVWFHPAPWIFLIATVTWLVTWVRQAPCRQTEAGQPVNAFMRLCYSDIPVLYQSNGLAQGYGVFSSLNFEYPPVIGVVVEVTRVVARFLGAHVGPDVTDQQVVDAAYIFFGVNAVVLFGCFLVVVATHLHLAGRQHPAAGQHLAGRGGDASVPNLAWQAVYVAAAPVVVAAGLINWDLVAVALTSLAVLLWARRRPIASGLVTGVAVSAGIYPIVLVFALLLLCLRAGRMASWGLFALGGWASWLAINVPVLFFARGSWDAFWTHHLNRSADLGSIWYVLDAAGLGMQHVGVLAGLLLVMLIGPIIVLVIQAPRRPRLAQVVALVLIAVLVANRAYSPQYVLWLLPFIVLARPRTSDWAIWSFAEVLYWWAVWGHLEGALSAGGGGPDTLYWAAIALRIGVQGWVAMQIVHDMRHPWDDPVRSGYVDDPTGGVLDHTPDARWLAGPRRERVEAGLEMVDDALIEEED
ncbi:MAG TPA: glycosyltransferase 87 family protein [Propionibacteriaceae bacterium]|nr:glycosyltransferase 87 family protein [Propionibacteriaceae bacterium]